MLLDIKCHVLFSQIYVFHHSTTGAINYLSQASGKMIVTTACTVQSICYKFLGIYIMFIMFIEQCLIWYQVS